MTAPVDLSRLARGRRRLKLASVTIVAFAVAVALGVWLGHTVVSWEDLPDVRTLARHNPSVITRVLADDGNQILGEYAQERRIVLEPQQIPDHLKQAIVAVEDSGFYDHPGLNLRGIMRAAIQDARAGRVVEGGSSLTQQLARLMFLTAERSMTRKIKEAVLAIQIERAYSKDEILTFYCNEVYLGEGRYGVEAAARHYFGTNAADLSLAEAAVIAGLPQRPNALSPGKNPEAARKRRDHVLDRMLAVGVIGAQQADEAKTGPVVVVKQEEEPHTLGAYFLEDVRKYIEQHYGEKALYRDGLKVETTLDVDLQAIAERAVREGLLTLDKRRGWRGELQNVLEQGLELDGYQHPSWLKGPQPNELVTAVVLGAQSRSAQLRVGDWTAELSREHASWTKRRSLSSLLRRGDLALVRVLEADPDGAKLIVALEQEPEVEGALVAIDNRTGEIKAMVGGYSFSRSKFNRAVQAFRQTGSAFKPVVYAAALSSGFTAADTLFDEPLQIEDPHTGALYEPANYGGQYYGLTTIREALEKSRNPATVQLLQKVGYRTVIQLARQVGVTSRMEPFPSLALGVFEFSPLEITTAYTALANLGLMRRPYFIRNIVDRDGRTLYSNAPVATQVLSEDVAYLTTSLLEGVVQRGTGRKARSLGRPLAGKTGTTDDFTDAWFIGYSPSLSCGVWVGYDIKRSLGNGETGAVAALPIWMEFMEGALADRPVQDFVQPSNVERVRIDRRSGRLASEFCTDTIDETFIRGTAPITYCTEADHQLLALPYSLQREYVAEGLRSDSAKPPDPPPEELTTATTSSYLNP